MSEFERLTADQTQDAARRPGVLAEENEISFCTIHMDEAIFGIDTMMVREVLGRADRRLRREVAGAAKVRHDLRRVPLAPSYVAGVIPYRGEVLTILSLRALLGDEALAEEGCVLVLDDFETGEMLGLMVDAVNGVLTVRKEMREEDSCTLDVRSRAFFGDVYKLPAGLMVTIDPSRLSSANLAESAAFERRGTPGGASCVR